MCARLSFVGILVGLALAGSSAASFPLIDDAIFSRHVQSKALAASCRVVNEKGGSGTGTLIARDERGGLILTAAHVVEGKAPARVEFYTASSWPAPARAFATLSLVADDPGGDLALVRLDTTELLPEPIRLCPQSIVPSVPFRAFTVGCHEGRPTLLQGQVIARRWLTHPHGHIYELSFPSYPGRSGGALIDEHGLLVGVCYGMTSKEPGANGLYPSLDGVYALCDKANRPDLYQGAPDPSAVVLLVVIAKILFGKVLFALVIARKGNA